VPLGCLQAAVVGITCAQDVMESMEKRVKSRFSHRKIIVTGPLHFEV
jgi:origin recognition complex subunit 4